MTRIHLRLVVAALLAAAGLRWIIDSNPWSGPVLVTFDELMDTTRTAVIPPPGGAERGPSLNPKLGPPAAADPRFERALEHLRERRWAQARPLLSELSAGAPTDVRYRAYLHYLRGWEAFELGKDGEARAEWRRALACDPGLGMAQWALQKTGLG